MATDPARAKPRTIAETRAEQRAACREIPCNKVQNGKMPPCVLCVHEGRIERWT